MSLPYQPVPDTAKVVFHGTTGAAARPWSFGLHFRKIGFVQADLATLVAYLQTWANDLMGAGTWTGYHIVRIVGTDLGAVDGSKAEWTGDISGDDGTATPRGMGEALVMSMNAAGRGKWNQGRVYLPLLVEGATDEYDVTSGTVSDYEGDFDKLLTDLPAGWALVIVSRYLNGARRTTAVAADVVSIGVKSTVIGSQRRRLRRNRA